MAKNEKGQAVVEYAIILGLVSVCIISALTMLGGNVKNIFNLTNTSFSQKQYKEQVEVFQYKINDNFLGFYVDPDYEAKYQNVAYYLIVDDNKIPLTKGANMYCPAQVYCSVDINMKITDLMNNNAKVVMESNGQKVIDTLVWDF